MSKRNLVVRHQREGGTKLHLGLRESIKSLERNAEVGVAVWVDLNLFGVLRISEAPGILWVAPSAHGNPMI